MMPTSLAIFFTYISPGCCSLFPTRSKLNHELSLLPSLEVNSTAQLILSFKKGECCHFPLSYCEHWIFAVLDADLAGREFTTLSYLLILLDAFWLHLYKNGQVILPITNGCLGSFLLSCLPSTNPTWRFWQFDTLISYWVFHLNFLEKRKTCCYKKKSPYWVGNY